MTHFLLQKDSPRIFFEKLILQGNFEVILILWKTFRFSFICFAVKTTQVGNNCFLKKGHVFAIIKVGNKKKKVFEGPKVMISENTYPLLQNV